MIHSAADQIRPFHVEAYPAIDLRQALKRIQAGLTFLAWYDQESKLVGVADLALDGTSCLRIDARFRYLPHVPRQNFIATVSIIIIQRPEQQDAVTHCSSCQRRVRKIVFVDGLWRCMRCHNLTYRSRILSAPVRDAERLDLISQQLSDDQSRGMRRVVRFDLHERLAALQLVLGDGRAEARPHQQWRLSTRWDVPPPALMDVDGRPLTGIGLRDGGRSEHLELQGEPLFSAVSLERELTKKVESHIDTAYARCRVEKRRVSQLAVRRHFLSLAFPLPELGEAGDIEVANLSSTRMQATMMVPVSGEIGYFRRWAGAAAPDIAPVASLAHDHLVLSATCSRAMLPFVAELLRHELLRIRECLPAQRRHARKLEKHYPELVKQIVADEWLRLTTGLKGVSRRTSAS